MIKHFIQAIVTLWEVGLICTRKSFDSKQIYAYVDSNSLQALPSPHFKVKYLPYMYICYF